MPQEPAWLTREGNDQSACGGSVPAAAQAASRERRPGSPKRTFGDGAWAAPTSVTPEVQV